jgi:hypothetical protein
MRSGRRLLVDSSDTVVAREEHNARTHCQKVSFSELIDLFVIGARQPERDQRKQNQSSLRSLCLLDRLPSLQRAGFSPALN